MKKIITFSILSVAMILTACQKEDNPKVPTLERVPVPSLTKDASGTGTIVVSDIDNFVGKVSVDLFFKSDVPPQKMDLVIIKNGDKSVVKVLKANITTFPTLVTFTGPELTALFGNVETCDFFTVGVNITTQAGIIYEAFPAVGNAYGSGVSGQYGGVQTVLTYNTKVEYDPSVYSGNFIVVSDPFGDFVPGDVVVLTTINETQFSFLQPAVANPLPIKVTVDPVSLKASIAKQKIGDYFLWQPGYTNPTVQTIASNPDNRVIPCTQTLNLSLFYTIDQGDFGEEFLLVLEKQP